FDFALAANVCNPPKSTVIRLRIRCLWWRLLGIASIRCGPQRTQDDGQRSNYLQSRKHFQSQMASLPS
ncbi:MAG: hypothetical protein ACI9TZ_003192, partial [Yoonia sp.]